MTKFCQNCGTPVELGLVRCKSCDVLLVKERAIDKLRQVNGSKGEFFERKKSFWIINLIGAILGGLSVVLSTSGIGMTITQSLNFSFFQNPMAFPDDFMPTIIFGISAIFLVGILIGELNKPPDQKTLKNNSVTLIVVGALFILVSSGELLVSMSSKNPLLIIENFPVGSIPAFFAGGIALVSGIIGRLKIN